MVPTAAMALNGSLAAGITGSAVPLAWLVVGLLIVFVSPALVSRIGLHLEENEGLHVEEHAGPVP